MIYKRTKFLLNAKKCDNYVIVKFYKTFFHQNI